MNTKESSVSKLGQEISTVDYDAMAAAPDPKPSPDSGRLLGDDVERIAREVVLGRPQARPDSPREAKFRRDMQADCKKIADAGGIIELPQEIA